MAKRALVAGAGGFIGHHLVKYLVANGCWVRGVDTKLPEYEPTKADEFEVLDLRRLDNCLMATQQIDEVYHLAAEANVERSMDGPTPCLETNVLGS